jgi:hypothetical protein
MMPTLLRRRMSRLSVVRLDVQQAEAEAADPAGQPGAAHDGDGPPLVQADTAAIEQDRGVALRRSHEPGGRAAE